ncbi:MAG TPA: ParA family protein [Oligoflexia bacterium]|nr:ParA family protein [Oligoflexia bacterium]HMP49747.1 ParA family protein [Oligoflexia bacterium]
MRFKKTQIIALANQKGGCGKTTSSIAIAAAFNQLGYSVAVVDIDPQCNATESFGISPTDLYSQGKLSILDGYIKKRSAIDIQVGFDPERFDNKLFVIPGNKQLGEVGGYLETEAMQQLKFERAEIEVDELRDEHRGRLRSCLDSLRGVHDVIIIDTPPNLGYLMTSALVASDWFIIPVFPSQYDLAGLEELTVTIGKIRKKYNPTLKLAGVLLGNFDKSTKLDSQIYKLLCQKFGEDAVFQTTISRGVRMRELTFTKQTVFEFEGASQQADQFLTLVNEMINRAVKGPESSKALPQIEKVVERVENSDVDMSQLPEFEEQRGVING